MRGVGSLEISKFWGLLYGLYTVRSHCEKNSPLCKEKLYLRKTACIAQAPTVYLTSSRVAYVV